MICNYQLTEEENVQIALLLLFSCSRVDVNGLCLFLVVPWDVGWSVACDCDISWLYSLTFLQPLYRV